MSMTPLLHTMAWRLRDFTTTFRCAPSLRWDVPDGRPAIRMRRVLLVLIVLVSTPTYAQGNRAFCEGKPNGWYTHPTCHYMYKCLAGYAYDVPVKAGALVASTCALPDKGEPVIDSVCAARLSGLYVDANCNTYTLCEEGKASRHVVPRDTLVCEI